ncbi:MAG: hypothetical protein K9G33_04995 [Sneathiella sp.]|nr:hypothetical protein [Sneathiella sp.]
MGKLAALFVVMTVGLAGCAQTPATTSNAAQDQKSTAQALKPVEAAPPKKQNPSALAAIKPRILLEPNIVVGKTDAEIQGAFGDPNMKRKESPAEVWQYLTPGCALHLYFYPGNVGDGLVVRYIAINGRSVASFSDLDRKQCFNDHLKAVGAEEAFIAKKAS